MDESIKPGPGFTCRMPFIVSPNADKFDQGTRKLIRSHVMRGKKVKRTNNKLGVAGLASADSTHNHRTQTKIQDVISMYTLLQPGRFGTRLYFVDFPSEIEPSVLWDMGQVSALAIRIIFPLLTEIGFHPEGKAWLYPAGRDAVACHINAFAIESFIDRVLRRQPEDMVNPVATLHHLKGLKLLRERLAGNDDKEKISDATISVVLKLAAAAQFDGDVEISQQHMHGLRKMTDLRGGLGAFQGNPKLLVEIWRCDLGIALLANSDPVFYRQPAESLPEYPEQVVSSFKPSVYSQEDMKLVEDLDGDLAEVWLITRKFCLLVNLGTQTRMLIQPATIYGTMIAVMYRLLRMEFEAGTLSETLRLGLLAFTHHIFLQWQDISPPCHCFSDVYRDYLQSNTLYDTVSPRTSLWLLMIGAVSLFSVSDEPWLGDYLRKGFERCEIKSWKEAHEILKSSMWISLLDEKSGKHIYEVLTEKSGNVLGAY
ncbi:hypothetical protein BJ170DRAFT_635930 [Xylariales sp. AK1849]|nr:hypothetical protein BJ170DRAFT_635930 [Xylariales sp. AK1849]